MRLLFWLAGFLVLLLTTGLGYYLGKSSAFSTATNNSSAQAEPSAKILYYRNPMGLPDTSPTPKLDEMGMDYLPVYENELPQKDIVKIDSRKVQALGVQTHLVTEQQMGREIRALGTLAIDEASQTDVSARFSGSVTRLAINKTGQQVAKGEILFDALVPNLYYAELAYKQAVKKVAESATATAEVQKQAELQLSATMAKLDDMGVPLDEIERLQRGGEPFAQISYRSPASGTVLEKNLVQGARFTEGDRLYKVADLTKLWLVMQLPEQELSTIKLGDSLRVELLGERGKYRNSKIDFIYPTLSETTRSVTLRAQLNNTDNKLKPGQSAEVWLQAQPRKALVIPANALLDSGTKQWVLLALSEGIYQPQQVEVGERNFDWIEIKKGLDQDQQVVTNATFLIDSESRLQAALANFQQPSPTDSKSSEHTNHSQAAQHHHHSHGSAEH